jgi:hypothetical protein
VNRFSKATEFCKKSRFCGVTELFGQEGVGIINRFVVSRLFILPLIYSSPICAMREPAALEYVTHKGRVVRRYAAVHKQDFAPEQDSLLHAVHSLGLKDVWRLLAAGVDPNIPSSIGKYALHEAVRSPNPESVDMVRLLLQKKADPDIDDISTPFYIALIARDLTFEQRVAKVQALIAAGAQVDVARVKNLLNIKRTRFLAGEYYPGQPAELRKKIEEAVVARAAIAAQAQDLAPEPVWRLTV